MEQRRELVLGRTEPLELAQVEQSRGQRAQLVLREVQLL